MPRPLRCDSPLRVLNIWQKGHNGQVIFYYDEDREYYLECLQNACKKFGVVLLGYVLMSNHIHALFYGDIEKCASVFQSIGSTYVRWFNRKYGRTGTLWNSRFYSKPVQDEQQFLQTAAYIFNNPVKAGIVKRAENYRWSSFRDMDTKKFDEKARERYLIRRFRLPISSSIRTRPPRSRSIQMFRNSAKLFRTPHPLILRLLMQSKDLLKVRILVKSQCCPGLFFGDLLRNS